MLLDINLRLLFGACSYPGICRSAASNPVERTSDTSEQLRPWGNHRLLNVCVDLADHDPLIGIPLDDASTHATQAVLYRLQCTITLNKYVN